MNSDIRRGAPSRAEITDLLARVSKAEGPSRELDAEITALLLGGQASHSLEGPQFSTHRSYGAGTVFRTARPGVVYIEDTYKAEPLTASLDAALGLVGRVLPGWFVTIYQDVGGWQASLDGPTCLAEERQNSGFRPSPALALLAALLTAVQAQASTVQARDGARTKSDPPAHLPEGETG